MRRRLALLLVGALLLSGMAAQAVAVSVALAQDGAPVIGRDLFAGGGGSATGGNVTLIDTLGQPIIGPSSGSGDLALSAGYWVVCAAEAAGVPAVTVTRDAATVVLNWDANPNGAQYQVWISTNPYFDPDHPGEVAPILWPASPYRDTGAAASLVNHFYVVRGLNPCGAASGNSMRKGEFTFGLTPGN